MPTSETSRFLDWNHSVLVKDKTEIHQKFAAEENIYQPETISTIEQLPEPEYM